MTAISPEGRGFPTRAFGASRRAASTDSRLRFGLGECIVVTKIERTFGDNGRINLSGRKR